MNEFVQKVKSKILELIKDKHMTIYQLAYEAGVSEASIRNWFNKKDYTPSLESLQKVCHVLDYPLAQLFIKDDEEICIVNAQTKELVENYQKLENEQKKLLLELAKSYNK